MKKCTLFLLVILFVFTATSSSVADSEIHEGQWEITVEVEIPGMPMKMPPQTITQCIKDDDYIPQGKEPGQECENKHIQKDGNTYSWTTECTTPQGKITGKGKVSYQNDKMSGSMTVEGPDMKMISHYEGRRIGECK